MDMIDDLRIRNFKNTIIDVMNNEPLPLEVKRLVLSEILNATTLRVDGIIENFLKEQAKKAEEKPDPENSPG